MASSFSSPWPDPNSPVLSKFDFCVPLVELFQWLDVRDTLLGGNKSNQDVAAALTLARSCSHPDAMWLSSIFEGKDVSTKEDAREVFLLNQDDARALCFAWCLAADRRNDCTLLRRAAEMGNAFACSTLCEQVWFGNREEGFRLAQMAAVQLERDGFSWIGRCYHDGLGCKRDLQLSEENLFIAAELGHIWAAKAYGSLLSESVPDHWHWLGRVALRGLYFRFLSSFSKQVEQFFSGSGNATIVFLIGHALKGNIEIEKQRIFGDLLFDFDSYIGPANQAVSFYSFQIKSVRLAVDTWTLVSTRLRLIKDMRIYIGKIIWAARFEAIYKIECASRDQKRSRE